VFLKTCGFSLERLDEDVSLLRNHLIPSVCDKLTNSEGEPSMPTSASSLAPPPSSIPATPATAGEPPVQNIQMRSLIVTGDASVIIGRAGAHVNEIRVSFLLYALVKLMSRNDRMLE